jgi:CheY-like chemotaxis protein
MTWSPRIVDSFRTLKVLVVDDDRKVAETLAAILGHCGCQVTIAENGVEGLRSCQRSTPNVLITDVDMPLMNGLELAACVSKLCPSCNIILCSGSAVTDTLVPCPEARNGSLPLLCKPVNPYLLVAMVLGNMNARKMTNDAA